MNFNFLKTHFEFHISFGLITKQHQNVRIVEPYLLLYQHLLLFPPPLSSNFSSKVEKLLNILQFYVFENILFLLKPLHFHNEYLNLFQSNILLIFFLFFIECSQWLHSIKNKKGTSSSWDSQ